MYFSGQILPYENLKCKMNECIVRSRSIGYVHICLLVKIEIKTLGGIFKGQVWLFDSMDSSVDRVVDSRKSILFQSCAGFESHQCFHFFFVIFAVYYFIMYPLIIFVQQF